MPMPEQPPDQLSPGPLLDIEAQAAHEKLHDIEKCANCGERLHRAQGIVAHGPEVLYFGHKNDGCALVMMMAIISDRGNLSEDQMFDRMVSCDQDAFWEDLSSLVINKLEDGDYGT